MRFAFKTLLFTMLFFLLTHQSCFADPIYDVNKPHVIINQIYGAGDGGYVTHSFIELFNPTSETVDISGWSLQYRSSKDDENNSDQWQKYTFPENTVILSHTSLLIRCNPDSNTKDGNVYRLDLNGEDTYDLSWNQVIHTKGCAVVLRSSDDIIGADEEVFDNTLYVPAIDHYVDLLAVSGNGFIDEAKPKQAINWYEGGAKDLQSKKYGIRRISFRDSDNNAEDAEAVDYKTADIDLIRPRCQKDGS